jgi:hypothetical protein
MISDPWRWYNVGGMVLVPRHMAFMASGCDPGSQV